MKKVLMSLAISLASCLAVASFANTPATDDSQPRIKSLDDLTSTELINSFDVDVSKVGDAVQEYQKKVATNLLNGAYNPSKTPGVNVEFYRNKEVVIVTIPASRLFMPNDTVLRSDIAPMLSPIKQFLKESAPDKYRVLLVMHTDNNGSTSYTDALSLARVDAIFDWYQDTDADTRYLFPTASGASDPLVPNDTYDNRERNRRLEIYLIPGKRLVSSLKGSSTDNKEKKSIFGGKSIFGIRAGAKPAQK